MCRWDITGKYEMKKNILFFVLLFVVGMLAINSCNDEPALKKYKVDFEKGDRGFGSMSTQYFTEGVADKLSPCEFVTYSYGYEFDGWYEKGDVNSTYADCEEIVLYRNMTLVAKWTDHSDDNGGNNSGDNGGDNGGNNSGGNGDSNGGDNGGSNVSVPSAPTGVTASNWGNAYIPEIHISWNSVQGATSYKVYRSTSANGSYSLLDETTYTSLTDWSPRNGKNYYKVKAFNSAGGSDYSSYALYDHDPSSQLSPCPVHYTSHTATSTTISLRWSIPTTSGCGTPTTAYLRVKNPTSSNYADLQTLSGTATSASFSYPAWVNSEGYVYCGIITENSNGTSGGTPLVYNVNTGTWYGGNGKSISELNLNEEFMNFEK